MARWRLALGSIAIVALLAVAAALLLHPGRSAAPVARSGASSNGTRAALGPDVSHTLSSASFTLSYPARWTLATGRSARAVIYQLSSTGAKLDGAGIGPAGTVGVTIDEIALTGTRVGATPTSLTGALDAALLKRVVRVPPGARHVLRTEPPRSTSLDGAGGLEESFSYALAGVQNVQSDVLLRRGGRVLVVELDGEPGAARSAEPAYEGLLDSWRWR